MASTTDEAVSTNGSGTGLGRRLEGLLFFPVTSFDRSGAFTPLAYRTHVREGLDNGAGAVFACCGTGEFFSLDLDEYREAVGVAVREAAGRVPVVAGVGYGTALAKRFASAAEAAGADGLLVMPPYLVQAGQAGLLRHFEELSESTGLDLVLYQRDNAWLAPDTVARLSGRRTIVGFKDGLGDLDHLQRVMSEVRSERGRNGGPHSGLVYINGMPTAEMTALSYRALGVRVYSSAVFAFMPSIAKAFWASLEAQDAARVQALLDGFYVPFVRLRSRGSGYAVSLVKAGVRLRGQDVGSVRAPLAEPRSEDIGELGALIAKGEELVAKQAASPA